MEPREPPVSPAEPPSVRQHPFGPEPRRIGSAAWRAVAIAAGVVAVLAFAVLVLLTTQSHRLMDFALGQLEEQVDGRLPEDLGHAQRERLAAAFDSAREAVREKRVGIAGLRRLQDELLGDEAETLSAERVRELSEALEALDDEAPGRSFDGTQAPDQR